MKRKALLVFLGILFCVSMMIGGMSISAFAAQDAHGWSDRTGPGEVIDIRTTNEETGFSEIQMVYAHGGYNNTAIDVGRPFKISFSNDELGSDWGPAFMLTDGKTNAVNFSGAGSQPVIGRNQSPSSPSAWEGAKIQFCMPWQEDEPLLYLLNTASAGFYNGVTGTYDASAASTAMGQNVGQNGTVAAHPDSSYDFYFDIQNEQGNSSAGTGSRLVVTEHKADGTTVTATFWLTVTRSNFASETAYFAFASCNLKNYSFFKLASERTLIKSVASNYSVDEMSIDGKAISSEELNNNTFTAFYGDLVRLKVSGTNAMVRVGDLYLAPEADGYYYFYMPNATTTMTIQEADADYCTVTYDTDGGSAVYSRQIRSGSQAVRPAVDPTKKDFIFDGWYADSDFTVEYDFAQSVTDDTVIYAKWIQEYAVTYRLNGFADYVVMVGEGSQAPEAQLRNFHAHGGTGNKDTYMDVDSLELTWYTDENFATPYDFNTAVEGAVTLYGKLTEVKTYRELTASGWDTLSVTRDDNNTGFMDTMFTKSPFDILPDGTAIYNISKSADYGVYARALDVSKPIEISAAFTSVSGTGWFSFSFFDKLTLAQMSEANGINPTNSGSLIAFALDTFNGSFLTTGVRDIPIDSYGEWNDEGIVFIPGYELGEAVSFTLMIGEEAGSSYIEVNGEKAFELDVVRSDFQDGKAYLAVAGFVTQQAELNVVQEASFTDQSENGTVTVRREGSLFIATISPAEGYSFDGTITVGGEEVYYEVAEDCYVLDLAENEVLLYIADYAGGDIAAEFTQGGGQDEEPGGESGCGGCNGTAGAASVIGAALLGGAAVILCRKKKSDRR